MKIILPPDQYSGKLRAFLEPLVPVSYTHLTLPTIPPV